MACSLGDAVDGVVAGCQGLDECIEGGGIEWVGVRLRFLQNVVG